MEKIVTLVAHVVALTLIWALVTMLLWNWLMPLLFGLKAIGFLEAIGLNMLTGILFRSGSQAKAE